MDSSTTLSPFQSVLDTVGPQHEKALKTAFYNAAALIFVIISAVISVCTYYILEVFIRPLVWATLSGAFLYPFKRQLTRYVRDWLNTLQHDGQPLLVGVVLLPVQAVNESVNFFDWVIRTNIQLLGGVFVVCLCLHLFVAYSPLHCIFTVLNVFNEVMSKLLLVFSYPLAVWSILIGYVILISFYDKSQFISRHIWLLKNFSVAVWCMMLFHFVSLTGLGKVPLAVALIILMVLGVSNHQHEVKSKEDKIHLQKRRLTIVNVVDGALNVLGIDTTSFTPPSSKTTEPVETPCPEKHKGQVQAKPGTTTLTHRTPGSQHKRLSILKDSSSSCSSKRHRHKRSSDPYFIALFWLFALSRIWLNTWLLQLIPVLLLVYALKRLYVRLRLYDRILSNSETLVERMRLFYTEREELLFPGPVKGTLSIIRVGDRKVISLLCNCMDGVTSVFMILCLLVMLIVGTTILAIQVHHESSFMMTVSVNIFNKTIMTNEEYLRLLNLNDTEIRETFNKTLHSGYMFARHKMAVFISSTLMAQNASSEKLEAEVLHLLDQVYENWIVQHDKNSSNTLTQSTPAMLPAVNDGEEKEVAGFWNEKWRVVSRLLHGRDLSGLIGIVKENIGILYSVVDSIWMLFKGNFNLAISIVSQTISIVFSSGTYLLNGAFSLIIFTTTLFYLLSSSKETYKPLEWLSGVSVGTRMGESVDKASQDVFGAALKMATFYGVYTWLTHSVLGANLVFIPAACASMLGVVPFIGTYWAAVPAALELFLIQEKSMLALLLLVLHFIPSYVVDTAIYSEIGGHPYLTGLAVAGGIMCIGLEGAFVGPFFLCSLVAAFDIYNRILDDRSVAASVPNARRKESAFPKALRRALSEDPN